MRVIGDGLRVSGSGLRFQGLGLFEMGLGFRVQGFRFGAPYIMMVRFGDPVTTRGLFGAECT